MRKNAGVLKMKKNIINIFSFILFCTLIVLVVPKTNCQCCGGGVAIQDKTIAQNTKQTETDTKESQTNATVKLPKMLELGSVRCRACKAMEPVIEELKKNYAEKLAVEFHDVTQNYKIGEKYKIEMIPTQIFLDPEGKEIFRHTGFFSKDEIVAKWKELGYDLEAKE